MNSTMESKKNFKIQGEISALIWCTVAAVVCFSAHILVCAGTEIRPAVSGLIFLFAYLVAVAAVSIIIFKYKKARGSAEEKLSTSSNAIRDLLQQAHMPIVLTDSEYNAASALYYLKLDVGSFGNSSDEATSAALLFAEAFAEIILG